jgi:RHS repeat-associated protein
VKSTFTVSPANEVLSLTSSQSNSTNPAGIISGVQNGPNGPLSFGFGNGLSGVYSYDTLGRLSGGWVCSGSTSANCSGGTQTYGFTAGWRGEQLANSFDSALNQNSSYGYDEFNRLTSRTVNSGTIQNLTWIYDRWGNRTQQTASPSGPQPSYSFNTSTNQITGLNYDAAGNLTNDGTPHSYTYDAEGNITAVDGGQTAQYVYDALNHRVRTVVGGNATEFLYNAAGQRASIWDGSTHAQKQGQYYWGGKPVAYYSGGSTHFQHQDWVGTERMRTGYNASVEGSFTSLPFGDAQTTVAGTDGDSYHFATLDHDPEDNTDHAQFRQYSNTQGRWLSPDPYAGSYDVSNPQSFNRYAYVLNNPLALVDRLGLDECSGAPWDGGFEGGVGGSDPFCPPDEGGGHGGPSGPPEIGVNLPSSGPGNTPGTAIPDNDPVWAETLGMPAGWMPQPQDLASIVQDTLGLPTMADVGCNPICDATKGAQNNLYNPYNTDFTPLFCAGDALKSNGVALGLDAAGFIPGEGFVAGFVQMGISGAAAVNAGAHNDQFGANLGIYGMPIPLAGAAFKEGGASFAKAVPFVGWVVNGIATARDLKSTRGAYQTCIASKKYD